ncbi:serine/threonine-protein phosphatase CPPED1-like [Neocloeon triangulifer]|uniref:serine/threonine-protein phosphatase CPPED1-like n=1 Tax=Neocloeon triangulifer TaxID=2078957 RepID=UPI00286ED0AA|nr:serine/threonine-protein phosphatase CPPED1-like [Neocloeon triangulifer]
METEWKNHNRDRTHYGFEEKEKKWQGPYFFIQAADCQLGLIQRYLEKNPTPGWQQEIALTKLAVEKINKMNQKPKFFVICGDLCDAFPAKEPALRAEQEKDLKDILSRLDPSVPLVCVCGNHDVGDQPTKQDLLSYQSSFGDDFYSFWCGGVFHIVVNSQFWFDSTLVQEEAEKQDQWLEEQLRILKTSEAKFGLIFQHIPWFLSDYEEEATVYFTLRPEIRQKWLPKFREAGVKAVFCGHYHRNAGGFFEDLEMVTTTAIGAQLGSDESGMRIVKVLSDSVEHEYFPFEKFPDSVQL